MPNTLRCRVFQVAVAIAALLAIGLVGTAQAQELTSFDAVPAQVKLGKTIWVTCIDGRKLEGQLTQVSPASLGIRYLGLTTNLQAGEIRTISRRGPRPWAKGVMIGLVIGSVFGATAVASDTSHGCFGSCGVMAGVVAAFFGGIGAGVGAGVAAGSSGKKILVYERAPGSPPARLSVSPVVTPARQGVMFSLRF